MPKLSQYAREGVVSLHSAEINLKLSYCNSLIVHVETKFSLKKDRSTHSISIISMISPQSGVTMLNNIVNNIEQCGQHNIVQGCFHQP